MTADFKLRPVYYPATYLRRATLSRLAYLFGRLKLLRPPGLTERLPEDEARIVEPVELSLSPERRRLLAAVLADYLRWAAEHQGAAYALYVQQRLRPPEETIREVRHALRQDEAGMAADQGRLPEDFGWQILLRLAHDYDRDQDEIEALLARVSERERQLPGLAGVGIEEEPEAGPPEEAPPEVPEAPPAVPEDLSTGGRMVAFGRLWLATHTEGTPVTDSVAAHEHVLERAARLGAAEGAEPVEFALALPDAGRLTVAAAVERREATRGPLEGVLARLETLHSLLRAREWSEEVRASVDLLALETREAAARLRAEAEAPKGTIRLRCGALPHLEPQRLFARLTGNPEPGSEAGGLYLLLE